MKSLQRILALARFEMRLTLRLVRIWVLGIIALGLGVITAGYYMVIHRFFSGFSGPFSLMTHELWVIQSTLIMSTLLGLFGVFVVFDWRHRDEVNDFAPTIGSSPVRPLEHAWGKFLGIAAVLLMPLAVLLLIQIVVALSLRLEVSPLTYLLAHGFIGVPFTLGTTAIAFGFAGLIPGSGLSRIAAIVAPFVWLGGAFGLAFTMPEVVLVAIGGLMELPLHSVFTGYTPMPVTIVQRVAGLLLVVMFVSLAALGPLSIRRTAREQFRRRLFVAGTVLAYLGATLIAVLVYRAGIDERADIVAAERAIGAMPAPRVLRRDIVLDVRPGREMKGTATLSLRNDGTEPLSEIPLRLNASLAIESIEADGAPVTFTRDRTAARVALPMAAGQSRSLVVRYAGSIDRASVDASTTLKLSKGKGMNNANTRFMGDKPLVFHRRAVMLGFDSGYYPDVEVLFGADYPDRFAPDIAPGSLTVTLPEGWRAGSVGERSGEGTVTFTSDEPVPGFALVAAKYEEILAEAGGVRVRFLHHPAHRRNVEFFKPAALLIAQRAAERLADVHAATGLSYPHPELTIAEVPVMTQTFAPSWDAPNRLSPPGMALVRENMLFGARFEQALKSAEARYKKEAGSAKKSDRDNDNGVEVKVTVGDEPSATTAEASPVPPIAVKSDATDFDPQRARADVLRRFIVTDFFGSDLERLIFASFFEHRIQPRGKGQPILARALPTFLAEIATGRVPLDSPEVATVLNSPALGPAIGAVIQGKTDGIAELVIKGLVDLDDTYAQLEQTPLEKMDPIAKPKEFLGALYVKGRQPLIALRDALGPARFAAAVNRMLQAPDRVLTWEIFEQALLAEAPVDRSEEVRALLARWLDETALPGYVVSNVQAFRLPGEAETWQVVASVVNDGKVEGTARFQSGIGESMRAVPVTLAPGQALEVGLVVPARPETYTLKTYLARNRVSPSGKLAIGEEEARAREGAVAFEGTRVPGETGRPASIVVDNLDPGFTVVVEGVELAYGAPGEGDDKWKLPEFNGWNAPGRWARWRPRGTLGWFRPYGQFDETAAIKRATEEGASPAIWRTQVPIPGQYRVEAYLPSGKGENRPDLVATMTFVIISDTASPEASLAADAIVEGWNDLGTHRFSGPAEIRLLDRGKEGLVVADAVRFTPVTP